MPSMVNGLSSGSILFQRPLRASMKGGKRNKVGGSLNPFLPSL